MNSVVVVLMIINELPCLGVCPGFLDSPLYSPCCLPGPPKRGKSNTMRQLFKKCVPCPKAGSYRASSFKSALGQAWLGLGIVFYLGSAPEGFLALSLPFWRYLEARLSLPGSPQSPEPRPLLLPVLGTRGVSRSISGEQGQRRKAP